MQSQTYIMVSMIREYPDLIIIDEQEHQAVRNMKAGIVIVPYTSELNIDIGDDVTLKLGQRQICLKVIDLHFNENTTHGFGTDHPHTAVLRVRNMMSEKHKKTSTINIGTVTGEQVQVGDNNSQVAHISIQQLAEVLAKSSDQEAKGLLKKLLENSTVGSLIGAGASALITML